MKLLHLIFLVASNSLLIQSFDGYGEVDLVLYKDELDDTKCRMKYHHDDQSIATSRRSIKTTIYHAPIYRARCQAVYENNVEISTPALGKNEDRYETNIIISNPGIHNYSCEFYIHNCTNSYSDECYSGDNKNGYYYDHGVQCVFSLKYNGYDLQPYSEENLGEMAVGHKSISFSSHYHASSIIWNATHKYHDREPTLFSCRRYLLDGFVRMVYTQPGSETIDTDYQSQDYLEWYIKLTAEHHGGKIECYITNNAMSYFDRHILYLENIEILTATNVSTNEVLMGFEVNGLLLPPSSRGDMYIYEYKYNEHEPLKINIMFNIVNENYKCKFEKYTATTEKWPESNEAVYTYTEYKNDASSPATAQDANEENITYYYNEKYFEVQYKKEDSGSMLKCWIESPYPLPRTPKFSLKFVYDHDKTIDGLLLSNVLMRYKKASYDIRSHTITSDTVVVYEHKNSTLTCDSFWSFNNGTEVTCSEEYNYLTPEGPKTCTFNLMNGHTNATVHCGSYHVELIQRKPGFVPYLGNDVMFP